MKEHKHPRSIALFLPPELCSENCREAAHDYRVIVPRDTAAKWVCVLVMRAKEWERQYLIVTLWCQIATFLKFHCLLSFCGDKLKSFSEKFLSNLLRDTSHSTKIAETGVNYVSWFHPSKVPTLEFYPYSNKLNSSKIFKPCFFS